MSEKRTYRVIPRDGCHNCELLPDHSMPVAISEGEEGWLVVRYICPRCRLVWDCGWSADMMTPFEDRYVNGREDLSSRPFLAGMNTMFWPAGPSERFTKGTRSEGTERN